MIRCAIYIRVSTAMQRMEGWSLDAQRAGLQSFAEIRGWTVIGVYADEGKTARKRLRERREIFRLLDDVRERKVDLILFKELDRWFRNVSDFYKVQDVLDEYGVSWVSERQPTLDMKTKEGRLAVNVLLSVGQNEADATSERIRYTSRYLVQQKRWPTGQHGLPRGFALDGDQHLIIDREQEPLVRELIRRVMETGCVRQALLEVNAAYGINIFYNNAIRLLRNPLLMGEYRGVKDFCEPYLTPEEFEDLQDRVRHNIKRNSAHPYIFRGLVRCGYCGRSMAGIRSGGGGKSYGYKCVIGYNQQEHRHNMLNEKRLEAQLLPFVREALRDRIVQVREVISAGTPRRSNRAQIEKKLDRLEDLYISSERMTREKYEAKKAALLSELVEDPPQEKTLASLEDIQRIFDSGIDAIYSTMSEEEKGTFWREVLRTVTVKDGEIIAVDFRE